MNRSNDLFLFRLVRLASLSGQPLIRLCEGQYGITRREWRLIVVLNQEGPLLSTELARRASIEPARTSKAVTQLVSRRLVERVPRSSDRRYVEIHLTERAQAIYRALYPMVQAMEQALLEGLSVADQDALGRILGVLEGNAAALATLEDMPKANRSKQVKKAESSDKPL